MKGYSMEFIQLIQTIPMLILGAGFLWIQISFIIFFYGFLFKIICNPIKALKSIFKD